MSAEKVLGGRHFHLASAHLAVRHVSDLDGHRYVPEIFDPASDMAVSHADLQQHDHAFALPGVVHIADDSDASTQNPPATLIRSVHDLHLLVPSFGLSPDDEAARGWAAALARRFDSHVSPPLERPPQV
jgi:hypothetical protein